VIEPPLWLIVIPLGAVVPVYLLRHRQLGAYLAAFASLFVGILAVVLPPTNAVRLAGRIFLLDPLTQYVLATYFVVSALLYVAGQPLRPGRYFLPLGLCISGLFAIAVMSRHLAISGLMMTLAAIAAVPIIQGELSGSVRGSWRFLVVMCLALPCFLLAAWHIDVYREDAEHAVYLPQAAVLLAIGFSLWLAALPAYSALTSFSTSSPPVSSALVLIGFPMMGLTLLGHVLAEASWFSWWSQTGRMLLVVGLVSVTLGGVLTFVQRSLRVMLGYAALYDLGCLLIALAVQGAQGAAALYAGLATRALGLALLGIATATLLAETKGDALSGLCGVGRRRPLAVIALGMGSFTLVGAPLAAGFAGRWLMLRNLAQMDERWMWLVLLAGLGVAFAYLRALYVLLRADAITSRTSRAESASSLWLPTSVLLLLSLATIALGIFPNPILRVAALVVTLYPLPRL